MAGLMQSVGGLVGAGVKGLMDMAEGYIHPHDDDERPGGSHEHGRKEGDGESEDRAAESGTPRTSISGPVNITAPSHPTTGGSIRAAESAFDTRAGTSTSSPASVTSAATSAASAASAMSHLSISQARLVDIQDVPSGWIHLQSAYLDGNIGERKVRSFGLRALGDEPVRVDIASDLGAQVVFWKGEDERDLSSAASYSSASSASSSAGSTHLTLLVEPASLTTVCLAFTPSRMDVAPPMPTPPIPSDSADGDGDGEVDADADADIGTPRMLPALTQQMSANLPLVPILSGVSSHGSAASGASDNDHGSISSASAAGSVGSSQSVAGSFKGPSNVTSTRRPEPVHRAFSVHGSISIRALTATASPNATPLVTSPPSIQHLSLPFFATVCKSLFTAALIDPVSGLVTGSQQMSGQMTIDFGSDSIVGEEYHRDILLVNRSEIELVWMTAVVNARYKDAAWFSLRDLDSENVFGVDTSTQPVPLPALSSRHLRLELRVKEPVPDFGFDFVISNVNQSGNLVTCRAIGSGQPETSDQSLKVLSGTTLDFGQIVDGVWAKKLVTCKNAGDRSLDVKFSASPGVDVVFRLAGVAGDDVDDDLPLERIRPVPAPASIGSGSAQGSALGQRRAEHLSLSRTSTKDTRGRSVPSPLRSRNTSPDSSAGRAASVPGATASELARRLALGPGPGSEMGDSTRDRDASLSPSRPLSRVTSRTSSYKYAHTDGTESDEDEPSFFSAHPHHQHQYQHHQHQSHSQSHAESSSLSSSPPIPRAEAHATEMIMDRAIPNQIEELAMRPGTEYRIFVLYRPARDTVNPPEVAAQLRKSSFKIYLDSQASSRAGTSATAVPAATTRVTLQGTAESCTSLIHVASGSRIDFGQVTVGASKSTTINIRNLSQLSAKVEIAAISKVLSTNRNVIVIPPGEGVEEKLEFFPRRINERYEKQIFVRNLLNRSNDQLVEIRSQNVDVNNLTLHSHLYRILTPNGTNFLDFGSVVINSPTIRTLVFENLTSAALVLSLMASQPEDVELYVKVDDAHQRSTTASTNGYADSNLERITSPQQNGELKERFIETLRELSTKAPSTTTKKSSLKGKDKKHHHPSASGHPTGHHHSHAHTDKAARSHHAAKSDADGAKQSVGAAVAAALKKGGRGRPVLLYGNAVMFKDRSLLDQHEHLDLAAGPPISAHRTSPRSKKSALLDSIESGDKSKLSGQLVKVPKLHFSKGGAKKEEKEGKHGEVLAKGVVPPPSTAAAPVPVSHGAQLARDTDALFAPSPQRAEGGTHTSPLSLTSSPVSSSPDEPLPSLIAVMESLKSSLPPTPDGGKSPALTGKRAEPPKPTLTDTTTTGDVSKMSIDELLVAFEQYDARRSMSATGSGMSLEEEEAFVRRTLSLRKEIQGHIASGRLVPARQLAIPPSRSRQLIVLLTPNGSIRPHISTRPKRADSRIFIRLNEFDRSYLSSSPTSAGSAPAPPVVNTDDLPVRDLIVRSSAVRSVLEVQQSSINFGNCEKGEVKSKTIVIQNKSDCVGLFRLRTSGSIASGDLKLGLGRYGVVSAFGRKEVENFSFTPSLVGNYQENIVVENVLDSYQDQNVSVKANVRRQPTFSVEPASVDFGTLALPLKANTSRVLVQSIVLTNLSKVERTFLIESGCNADSSLGVSLSKDDSADAGTVLSKAEEEEAEGMLQKLKIARRKGKSDKVSKYEARLSELGVAFPPAPAAANATAAAAAAVESDAESTAGGDGAGETVEMDGEGDDEQRVKASEKKQGQPAGVKEGPGAEEAEDDAAEAEGLTTSPTTYESAISMSTILADQAASSTKAPTTPPVSKPRVTSLSVTIGASQKVKILVEVVARSVATESGAMVEVECAGRDLAGTIKVFERKNTDETILVAVSAAQARSSPAEVPTIHLPILPIRSKQEVDRLDETKPTAGLASSESNSTTDTLHLSLMRHCLDLTLLCPVSPTAFCVGSTLFLAAGLPLYSRLKPHFDDFPAASTSNIRSATSSQITGADSSAGLILADGYSREIPGNTHAEANALTNFRTKYAELAQQPAGEGLPAIEEVLRNAECYATMEPCSVRTSGGPSCALELVRAKVKTVYLGVEEPPDFVSCDGVRILEQGGVKVVRVLGLEEQCLKAARRGRE